MPQVMFRVTHDLKVACDPQNNLRHIFVNLILEVKF